MCISNIVESGHFFFFFSFRRSTLDSTPLSFVWFPTVDFEALGENWDKEGAQDKNENKWEVNWSS